jgi:hypothetical protein
VSGIRTNAAAVMLGISPNTLRSWERRYGFPSPARSAGGHRQYLLAAFDEDKANRLLDESLALRSLERTLEEVLLEALAAQAAEGNGTAEYEFGWRYATGWMSALKRLSPPASRPDGVLLIDACAALDLDGAYAQALELVLRRAGLRTLALSPGVEPARLGRALRALAPRALVLTGQRISLDAIGRLVYAVRGSAQGIVVFDYRGAVPDTGASTVHRLGESPTGACDLLLSVLEQRPAERPVAPGRPFALSG